MTTDSSRPHRVTPAVAPESDAPPAGRPAESSDRRVSAWALARARQKRHEFLRRNWADLLGWVLAVVGVLALSAAFAPDPFARGLIGCTSLVGAAGVMWRWTVHMADSATNLTGDVGVQCTARELRRLRRRGWLLINHVTLTTPDTDHVLVGPGGILVIESQWSAQEWTPDCAQLHAAAEQARRHALRLTLWHRLKPFAVGSVRPVVFLWGPGAENLNGAFELGGTTIVPGHAASLWRAGLTGGRLTPQQIDAAWQALHARSRETNPGKVKHPALPVSEWLTRAVLRLLAACGGFLAVSSVVVIGMSRGSALAWWALMLALGIGVARFPALRHLGLAWTGGVITAGVTAAIASVPWAM